MRESSILLVIAFVVGGCHASASSATPGDAQTADVEQGDAGGDVGEGGDGGDGGVACALPLDETARATRTKWMSDGLQPVADAFAKKFDDGAGGIACPPNDGSVKLTVHDLGDFALSELVVGGASDAAKKRAISSLNCLFSLADATGVFPFHLGDPPNAKDNPTEFALLPVSTILPNVSLPTDVVSALVPKVQTSLEAIEKHVVCPAYTNICLMQTAEMLSLGGFLARQSDATIAAYGKTKVASGLARLDAWMQFTQKNGVAEYDSATYGEVDLETLLVARRGAPDSATRARIEAALAYLWSDFSANVFAPRGDLAGPNSRTYDFFFDQGGLTISLWLEGVRADLPSQKMDLSKGVLLYEQQQSDAYHPPASALCLSALPTREILSTYGADAAVTGKERYAWITQDFSLGSTSSDYGTSDGSDQDLLLRGELASSGSTAHVAVIADALDAPGTSVDEGDFTKVTHLLSSPASAQKNGAMLSLLKIPAKDPKYTSPSGAPIAPVNLSTNVVYPSAATITFEEPPPYPARATFVLRLGNAALAVAFVDAGGVECPASDGSIASTTAPVVETAAIPGHSDVARVALYHSKTTPSDTSKLASCFARVAIAMLGARCDGDGCDRALLDRLSKASATASVGWDGKTGDWDVRIHPDGAPELHVHRVVGGAAEKVIAREVDGAPLVFPPLSVNGATITLGP